MPKAEEDGRNCGLRIMLTQGELQAIDDVRFSERYPSRAAAVRELIEEGLRAKAARAAEEETTAGHQA